MAPLQPQAGHVGLLLPLCSSSATIGLALYQYPQFYSFLRAEPSIAGKTLSRYWDPMIKSGYVVIIANTVVSVVGGTVAARWLSTHTTLETSDVAKWYTYGSILAASHLAFTPLILGPVRKMIAGADSKTVKTEEETDSDNRKEMNTWFLFHTIRTLLLDVPALVCFAEGAALSFWVGTTI